MNNLVIVAAARTPIGRLNGSLASLPAHALGAVVLSAVASRAGVPPAEVSDVILGQVLTAGAGQNPARQAALDAGFPVETTAAGVNQVCGSGLRSIAMGCQALRCGDAEVVIAGGQESMSSAPHCVHLRTGTKFGDASLRDTMVHDGLWDHRLDCHMGTTAENVARQWQVSRAEQDEFALHSQQKAAAAQRENRFADEIVPVVVKGSKASTTVALDECIRPDTTLPALSQLKPVFAREDGTVTAGNSSGLSDGAAAVMLMTETEAKRRGCRPLARIAGWAMAGVEPRLMGIGPAPATKKLLARAGWKLDDVDLIEANEAFAAQSCAVRRELGWDPARVNVHGGALALGHPIGASGARIVVTLLHAMAQRDTRRGIATLCIGGGMGIAMAFERID